jgi:hypothetical protein
MSLGTAYASAANYRAATGMVDTSKDAEILKDLEAISRHIDFRMGRFFNKNATDATRIYVAEQSTNALWVDDLSAAPTTVKVDTTRNGTFDTTITDYELLPLNASIEPEPHPFTQIRLLPWSNKPYFSKGERVEVVGKFGWPAVPEAVKRATIQLTAILRLESPRATTRIPEMGDVISTSPEAQHIIRQLLDQYKRRWYV